MNIKFFLRRTSLFLILVLISGFFLSGFTMVRSNLPESETLNIKKINQNQILESDQPFLIFLPLIQRQEVKAYYVSPQGNDTNPGTLLLPWKTINKAARTVVPDDLVYIRSGIYHEYVSINTSGTQSQPIRFFAYPGESPVMDGENILPINNNDGLLTIDGDWVEINGLEVRYSHYVGISLYGRHNLLSNVFVHHSWRNGIYINGDFGTVQDSRIWRNSMHSEYGREIGSSGIASSFDESDDGDRITDYTIIRRNMVWENWGQGIDIHHSNFTIVEENSSYDNYTTNIYIHDTTNVLCQNNFIYMNSDNSYMADFGPKVGIEMGQEYDNPSINVENIQVLNNILFGNHRNLFWYTGHIEGAGMTNVLFANNTFVNGSGDSSNGNANIILDYGVNSNVRFINNLVQQDDVLPLIDALLNNGITYSYNLWSKNRIKAVVGTGDIVEDPKLVKIGQPYSVDWFRLSSSSPAINTASIIPEVTEDYFGFARGTSPDRGAIEYLP